MLIWNKVRSFWGGEFVRRGKKPIIGLFVFFCDRQQHAGSQDKKKYVQLMHFCS